MIQSRAIYNNISIARDFLFKVTDDSHISEYYLGIILNATMHALNANKEVLLAHEALQYMASQGDEYSKGVLKIMDDQMKKMIFAKQKELDEKPVPVLENEDFLKSLGISINEDPLDLTEIEEIHDQPQSD